MADSISSGLLFLPFEEDEEDEEEAPHEILGPFVPVFSYDPESDYPDDHASLALDLFDRRVPLHPIRMESFPVSPPEEIRLDYLGLNLGLGLGLEEDDGGDRDREVEVSVASDWGADDFFVGRRSSTSDSIEFSRARPVGSDGLRITGFDSDSDSDEQIVAIGADMESIDVRGQRRDPNEDFEWEEVDGRLDDRDVVSITIVGNGDDGRDFDHDVAEQEEEAVRNLQWEVLLAVNSLGRSPMDPDDVEGYFVDDHEGFVYTSDIEAYEVLFGQFADHESSLKGSPPAAKSVVESLPSVVLTKEDIANDDVECTVCRDGILVEERVKRLPCSHYYHEDCILPWLAIRNTCPLCRYELPTDDPEYEKWKARRGSSVVAQD
ncbi:uncharacterized protein [Typha latifolia]|uniref:uncharacterized protein n=1 Tax=Typha latifolia TaxID=4733 RepID=UPI003C2BDD42